METSGRLASLAALLAEDRQLDVLEEVVLSEDMRTAQSLPPTLRALIDQCEWTPESIDLVCVSTGPGSFTGLRIGVTAAKTWAYATGAALVGMHTLAALAAGVPSRHQRLWAVLDAQRQELFTACFTEGWQAETAVLPETNILRIDDWMAQLSPGDAVVGPPLKKLAAQLPAKVVALDATYWKPRASVVGRLGFMEFQRGRSVDPMQLVPNYFRKSAAEEKADR